MGPPESASTNLFENMFSPCPGEDPILSGTGDVDVSVVAVMPRKLIPFRDTLYEWIWRDWNKK